MSSNFQFILTSRLAEPRRTDLYTCCTHAERCVCSDPQISVIEARNAAEVLVGYFYTARRLGDPAGKMLSELLGEKAFRDALDDRPLMDDLHFIRKTGNTGAHGGITSRERRVDADDALLCLKILHRAVAGVLTKLNAVGTIPPYRRPEQGTAPSGSVPRPAQQAVPKPAQQVTPRPAQQAVPKPAQQVTPRPAQQPAPKPARTAGRTIDEILGPAAHPGEDLLDRLRRTARSAAEENRRINGSEKKP